MCLQGRCGSLSYLHAHLKLKNEFFHSEYLAHAIWAWSWLTYLFPQYSVSTREIDHIDTFLLEVLWVVLNIFHSLLNSCQGFEWNFDICSHENFSKLVSDPTDVWKVSISIWLVSRFIFLASKSSFLNGFNDVFIIVS